MTLEAFSVLVAFAAFRGAGTQLFLHAFHLAPRQGLIKVPSQGPDSDVIYPGQNSDESVGEMQAG